MGASLCGKQGTQYLCNNRHVMEYISIAQNPQDILNDSSPSDVKICVKCNRGVQQCQAKVAWGCQKCKFYYCAKCKGYKADVCAAGDKLTLKSDFKPRDDAFCDICQAPIDQKAFHCNKCKFNLCPICHQNKQTKKK